jgi:hypothetical protein
MFWLSGAALYDSNNGIRRNAILRLTITKMRPGIQANNPSGMGDEPFCVMNAK